MTDELKTVTVNADEYNKLCAYKEKYLKAQKKYKRFKRKFLNLRKAVIWSKRELKLVLLTDDTDAQYKAGVEYSLHVLKKFVSAYTKDEKKAKNEGEFDSWE